MPVLMATIPARTTTEGCPYNRDSSFIGFFNNPLKGGVILLSRQLPEFPKSLHGTFSTTPQTAVFHPNFLNGERSGYRPGFFRNRHRAASLSPRMSAWSGS